MWWIELFNHFNVKEERNELLINCPYCGDTKHNLQVNKEMGIFHCWVCHKSGRIEKLFRDFNIPFSGIERDDNYEKVFTAQKVDLPEGFQKINENDDMFSNAARHYLHSRKLTDSTINTFNLGYIRNEYTIVVPLYEYGELVYWVSRNYKHKVKSPYKNPATPKTALLPIFFSTQHSKCVLCEGVFDALIIHQHGYTAIPLLGKTLSDMVFTNELSQLQKLKHFLGFTGLSLSIMLDADATEDAFKLQKKLMKHQIESSVLVCVETDPNSLPEYILRETLETEGIPSNKGVYETLRRRLARC